MAPDGDEYSQHLLTQCKDKHHTYTCLPQSEHVVISLSKQINFGFVRLTSTHAPQPPLPSREHREKPLHGYITSADTLFVCVRWHGDSQCWEVCAFDVCVQSVAEFKGVCLCLCLCVSLCFSSCGWCRCRRQVIHHHAQRLRLHTAISRRSSRAISISRSISESRACFLCDYAACDAAVHTRAGVLSVPVSYV